MLHIIILNQMSTLLHHTLHYFNPQIQCCVKHYYCMLLQHTILQVIESTTNPFLVWFFFHICLDSLNAGGVSCFQPATVKFLQIKTQIVQLDQIFIHKISIALLHFLSHMKIEHRVWSFFYLFLTTVTLNIKICTKSNLACLQATVMHAFYYGEFLFSLLLVE